MKLSPSEEQEILQLMEDYWNSYFEGNLEKWASYIPDHYRNIGTTQEEIWENKKQIVDYTRRIFDQMVGMADFRNKTAQVITYDPHVMVHEIGDLFVKAEEDWVYYAPFRLSSLLEKTEEGWKILHQHGSFPDLKAAEGEAFGLDAVKAENERLKKAVEERTLELELQKKELEIEAALERVRSKSLTMHQTSELQSVIHTVHEELLKLNLSIFGGSFIVINSELDNEIKCWGAGGTADTSNEVHIPRFEKPFYTNLLEGIKKGPGFFTEKYSAAEKEEFFAFLFTHEPWSKLSTEEKKKTLEAKTAYTRSCAVSKHTSIFIINQAGVPFSVADNAILKRFGKVFEQSYTRFLDLQKAEAQAREAQIEASLERVRATSLAMHTSQDLSKVVYVVFTELVKLDAQLDRCLILTVNPETLGITWYLTGKEGLLSNNGFLVENNPHPSHQAYLEGWRTKRKKWHYLLEGEEKKSCDKYLFSQTELAKLPDFIKADMAAVESIHLTISSDDFGCLIASSISPLPEAHAGIVDRFTSVFNQTYTRFLDLQKAEAQAREAQVQLALERVRARTMAMQGSEELAEVSYLLNKQVVDLGIPTRGCAFNIYDENDSLEWFSNLEGTLPTYRTPRENIFLKYYEAGQRGESLLIEEFGGERIKEHYKYLATLSTNDNKEEKIAAGVAKVPDSQIDHVAYFKYGYLLFITLVPAPEAHEIFKRFAKEFEQTYTRFLDLQKAEAQARESKIELSLERIRAQVTSMQESSDLFDIVVTMRKEFVSLGYQADYFWHMRWTPEQYEMSMTSEDGNRIGMVINVPKFVHDDIPRLAEWEKSDSNLFVLDLNGPEAWDYIEKMNTYGKYEQVDPHAPSEEDILAIGGLTFIIARTSHGEIGFSLPGQVPEPPKESLETLIRFAKVFGIAYKRFEDLKKAEEQAREAKIELSLERIRAKVSSMQESTELLDIMVSIRKEFVSLGHAADYFWYMRWLPDKYEKAMTSGDGSQVGMIMTLPRHIHGDIPLVANWEKGQEPTLVFPMDVETAMVYVDKMISLGDFELVDPNSPTLEDIQHIGGLTFVMARTSQGEIGYSLPGEVHNPPEEAVKTLARFAGVFDLAYARFEDLKKAERDLVEIKKAKKKAEEALAELKSAQAQLIQSEKMASLGELTAGIAHEIQNPLNFVNNFSEVSGELIDEAQQEIDKGDLEEIKFILQDLKDNLSKINHHGKRAGSIVKGMLEHSRKSEGKKELVDLNALADECLKLGFHGLRAKDKSFSADFKTDFSTALPQISIVRQDIGRVLLNLVNNAFYAVHDFGKTQNSDFKPIVSISTRKEGNQLEICVSDNGKGIPEHILDKIFQPFFTTKPTGEGTGLGLSLSYDIIKAHGGELTAINLSGGGAQFKITLPVVNASDGEK
ncbi:phospho-acceptor domain-containing protein [Algoriphagus boseongensis]|uniref:histidine kinase n=1 Tax=Algoriphagus boseongensis TaxID=1442587 RepID=A0A4R6T5V2_9BACT|nr:ATP-binding protein [Algoriphagus boseongensis]TDQ17032.1 phospho-acceptor domain-containing protein [Algoriphagus boseongensis]